MNRFSPFIWSSNSLQFWSSSRWPFHLIPSKLVLRYHENIREWTSIIGKRKILWTHFRSTDGNYRFPLFTTPNRPTFTSSEHPHYWASIIALYLSNTTAATLGSAKMTSPAQNSLVAFRPRPFPGESNIATFSMYSAMVPAARSNGGICGEPMSASLVES